MRASSRRLAARSSDGVALVRAEVERAAARVDELRPRIRALDTAMGAHERDRRVGGSVLAGALAFRLFVALMPFVLLLVVALGYASTEDPGSPSSVAHGLGVREAALNTIADSSRLSGGDRLGVAVFGLLALAFAAVSAARAIRAVSALAWGITLERFPRALSAALAFVGWLAVLIGLWALIAWARSSLGPGGILVTIALMGAFFLAWLLISMTLPHPPEVSWRALVPGAVLMAVGLEVMHLATVLYIAHKASEVSAVYGSLGIALVVLLWLYLFGRLVVASAFLNAALWERNGGDATDGRGEGIGGEARTDV